MIRFFKSGEDQQLNAKIDAATDLHKAGYTDAAKYLITDLVRRHPQCDACRFYMGKIFADTAAAEADEGTKLGDGPGK